MRYSFLNLAQRSRMSSLVLLRQRVFIAVDLAPLRMSGGLMSARVGNIPGLLI